MYKYLDPSRYVRYARFRRDAARQVLDRDLRTREAAETAARLRDYQESHVLTKLHFGCGPRVLRGWANIDLSFEPYEEYLQYYTDQYYPSDLRGDERDFFPLDFRDDGIPVASDSVDVIFHEDFIEHLSQRDQVVFLAETLRVLKEGQVHRVNTPDLVASMARHSTFQDGIKGVCLDEWDRHVHLNVLTHATLKELALMVGYRAVHFTERDASAARALLPLEYRPGHDRTPNGNIFADLIK